MLKPKITEDFTGYGISLNKIGDIAARSIGMLEEVKKRMMAPDPGKKPPIYSLSEVADLCKIERSKATYIVSKNDGDVPIGSLPGGNKKREFTLAEAQCWIRKFGPFSQKDPDLDAVKISIANFKGGVTKTTTTMTLAQGLSLRGKRVLIVDLDAQGSLTALTGLESEHQIDDDETAFPLIDGRESSLEYAVQKTYWDNVDLIPSSLVLYGAEFYLPYKQTRDKNFQFWDVINKGIEPLLKQYDVILFDTPPSLSYMTINALMASDALIIPMPPNALDFASGAQFWELLSNVIDPISKISNIKDKYYDFISIVITKSDSTESSTSMVRSWIRKTYGEMVLESEIPLLAAVKTTAAKFGTIYDGSDNMNTRTYTRALEAFESVIAAIDSKIVRAWEYRSYKKRSNVEES